MKAIPPHNGTKLLGLYLVAPIPPKLCPGLWLAYFMPYRGQKYTNDKLYLWNQILLHHPYFFKLKYFWWIPSSDVFYLCTGFVCFPNIGSKSDIKIPAEQTKVRCSVVDIQVVLVLKRADLSRTPKITHFLDFSWCFGLFFIFQYRIGHFSFWYF